MWNDSHGPRHLSLVPPSHDVHDVAHLTVEALTRGAERLRRGADRTMVGGHWGGAAWLEEQAALTEHRADLVAEEPLTLFWRH